MKIHYTIFVAFLVLPSFLLSCAEPPITVQARDNQEQKSKNDFVKLGPAENTIQFAHPDTVGPSHVRGARFYDDLTVEVGGPVGRNPLIDMANEPGAAAVPDADSWRCVTCHGYDFEGAFTFFNGVAPNLLELSEVRSFDEDYVGTVLMNGFDVFDGVGVVNVHNYSTMNIQQIVDVSDFVANELFDTHIYIKAATNGISVGYNDTVAGQELYDGVVDMRYANPETAIPGDIFTCAACHGADGMLVAGVMLPNIAWNAPWRFMFRTLFGSPRPLATQVPGDAAIMPGLYEITLSDGLHFAGAEQGANIQAYMQSLPMM